MTTRWERLAGDTDAFALKIAFAPDPDEGRSIDPDVSRSWGSFQIWVNGRNLCAHLEEGEHITSVHWYVLPLIEWFARHWNPLLHEERLPVKNDGVSAWESLRATRFPPPVIEDDERQASRWEGEWQAWWGRHALRAAREGGLFPDVVFRRLRDWVEVSWGPILSKNTPYRFEVTEALQGAHRLPPQAVAGPLHDVLSNASEYLATLAGQSRRIRALRGKLKTLEESAQNREQRLMWLAGLGANERTVRNRWRRALDSLSNLAEAPRRAILESSESPLVVAGSCQAALMFGSLAPNVGQQDVLSLAQTMVDLYATEGGSEVIRTVCRAAPVEESTSPAWSQGYELAEALHEHFNSQFVAEETVDIEKLVETVGVEVKDLELSDEKVRGVSIAGPQHRPGIVVNSRHGANLYPSGRRFTLAHELCHLLFDREAGSRLAIASGPWAPQDVEKRANAFAAMLLMPAALVQRAVKKLTAPLETWEGVGEVARGLRMGHFSVLSHLKNLGYIDENDEQRIKDEPGSSIELH